MSSTRGSISRQEPFLAYKVAWGDDEVVLCTRKLLVCSVVSAGAILCCSTKDIECSKRNALPHLPEDVSLVMTRVTDMRCTAQELSKKMILQVLLGCAD